MFQRITGINHKTKFFFLVTLFMSTKRGVWKAKKGAAVKQSSVREGLRHLQSTYDQDRPSCAPPVKISHLRPFQPFGTRLTECGGRRGTSACPFHDPSFLPWWTLIPRLEATGQGRTLETFIY